MMSNALSSIEKSIQNPPDRIKVDDRVMITNPEFVLRVGYPLSFEAAVEHVRVEHNDEIRVFLELTGLYKTWRQGLIKDWPPVGRCYKPYEDMLRALARMHLEKVKHGGPERTIHTETHEQRLGKVYSVTDTCTVKTGVYDPPYSTRSYEGDYDCHPGGLLNCKTHVLLKLSNRDDLEALCFTNSRKFEGIWIERCNVRKV